MIANDFAEFVSNQQSALVDEQESAAVILEEWLRDLARLHEMVIGFLGEYFDKGSIHYSFVTTTLTEENLGIYSAKKMEIRIGRQHIYLEPVGTLFIGSRGRVDLVGSLGRVPIFLVDKNVKVASDLVRVSVKHIDGKRPPALTELQPSKVWAWKIVSRTVPRSFIDLERDSFLAAVMEVANG